MLPILAVVFVVGCGTDPVPLLTGAPLAGGACFTNWAEGQLVADGNYGTAIVDYDVGGTATPVAWRPGFTARRVASEVEVLDPAGHVVATTGRRYRIDGGYVDRGAWPGLPTPVFWACDRARSHSSTAIVRLGNRFGRPRSSR